VKRTYQCTPDDGRVAAETYVGLIEQKYENKKLHSLVKKTENYVKMNGEQSVKFILKYISQFAFKG
jgi:hypothetical protein